MVFSVNLNMFNLEERSQQSSFFDDLDQREIIDQVRGDDIGRGL
jgi:hypothetical protein